MIKSKLTPVKFIKKIGQFLFWEYLCECGNKIIVRKTSVISGNTRSCGCLRKKHGYTGQRIYSTWCGIKFRTSGRAKKGNLFKYYTQKGIKCLWGSFEEFHTDMNDSYESHVKKFGEHNTTIDRIDSNGHYSKENCRWATKDEQARWTENRKPRAVLLVDNIRNI